MENLELLGVKLKNLGTKFDREYGTWLELKSSYDFYCSELKNIEVLIEDFKKSLEIKEKTEMVFKVAVDYIWDSAKSAVEVITGKGLASVFGPETKFLIDYGVRGNQVIATFVLKVGNVERNILDEEGGTLVDVVSFLLRLSILLLYRGYRDRVIILDEPFKMLSSGYIELISSVLTEFSERLGIQFILITHIQDFKDLGKCYEVDGGKYKEI